MITSSEAKGVYLGAYEALLKSPVEDKDLWTKKTDAAIDYLRNELLNPQIRSRMDKDPISWKVSIPQGIQLAAEDIPSLQVFKEINQVTKGLTKKQKQGISAMLNVDQNGDKQYYVYCGRIAVSHHVALNCSNQLRSEGEGLRSNPYFNLGLEWNVLNAEGNQTLLPERLGYLIGEAFDINIGRDVTPGAVVGGGVYNPSYSNTYNSARKSQIKATTYNPVFDNDFKREIEKKIKNRGPRVTRSTYVDEGGKHGRLYFYNTDQEATLAKTAKIKKYRSFIENRRRGKENRDSRGY